MPTLQKVLTLEITIEGFLNQCSDNELAELSLQLLRPVYQNKIKKMLDTNYEKLVHQMAAKGA